MTASAARLLRDLGYTVAFLGGFVYRYRPDRGVDFQPVDGGRWAVCPDNWMPAPGQEDRLMTIRLACYCGRVGNGTCDFCSGLRRPPPPPAPLTPDPSPQGDRAVKPNQYAFPFTPYHCGSDQAGPGLTKRELFAALALAGGVAACGPDALTEDAIGTLAYESVALADALLTELGRPRDE